MAALPPLVAARVSFVFQNGVVAESFARARTADGSAEEVPFDVAPEVVAALLAGIEAGRVGAAEKRAAVLAAAKVAQDARAEDAKSSAEKVAP